MKYFIVAVRDAAADCFGTPKFERSEGVAIRGFSDAVNHAGEDNILYAHPEQFDLYCLGSFDDATGGFDTCVPRMVISGSAAVIRSEGADKQMRLVK